MSDPKPVLDDTMDAALEEAFEEMTFTAVERVPGIEFDCGAPDLYWASLATVEPQMGEIALLLPPVIAYDITQSILGVEEDPASDQVLDVVAELVNTIGGSWLRALQDESRTVELGLPKTGRGSWCADGSACELAVYQIDDVSLGVALRPAAAAWEAEDANRAGTGPAR